MSVAGFQTVSIVGAGLIGASFGLALKRAGFRGRILAVSSPAALQDALRLGAVDEAASLEEAASQADLVFLARPILAIVETLPRLDACVQPHCLVTDAGSTKARIVEQARRTLRRAQFLGGHPMAGKEKRGAAEAEPELFRGRTWILTPVEATELQTPPARELLDWIRAIGAHPLVLSPEEHDRVVAFTSHLPQLLSTALAATLARRLSRPEYLRACGPGLLDMTRLAASPFEIWRDILATNAAPVGEALEACLEVLRGVGEARDAEALAPLFGSANEFAARLRGRPCASGGAQTEPMKQKKKVLFVCTGNSARSQMAEGLLRHLGGDRFDVASAGTHPTAIRPEAVAVMRELGVDISAHRSRSLDEFRGASFDFVVTVCDQARQSCPAFAGAPRQIHWNLEDPAAATGAYEERLAVFRRVRDELLARIRMFLAEQER
ncbi:MAG: prephenate dehydrogenase/arogenate dehydrogenase family protein [Bryobacterales bacterium]|nr:prephenate dehydrogenase/arogenate dehydrogenase family protein [Bryobacteraceae bacterium]MDW8131805.1 prephenate dehydrogenase/arogenate dehydrogenase family protein [Bryobacterales bacterium]